MGRPGYACLGSVRSFVDRGEAGLPVKQGYVVGVLSVRAANTFISSSTGHGTQVIHTTAGHLLWDPRLHRWRPASELKKGEHLKTPDGTLAVADGGTTPKVHDGWMWDLTVPGNNDHDFYIDTAVADVLVHNVGGTGPCGSRFSPNSKAKIWAQNADENGINTCANCGEELVPPEQSQPGVSPPGNEGQVDHIYPRSLGGNGVVENGQLLCRVCNLLKGNKWPWP